MGNFFNFKSIRALILIVAVSIIASGCLVRQYTVVRERPDQEVTGNQGYLFGGPSQTKERQIKTRKTYAFEVELGKPVSLEDKALNKEVTEDNIPEESLAYDVYVSRDVNIASEDSDLDSVPQEMKTYIVKKGDTLEKIAAQPEIYGDKKKWYKIYKANKHRLKSANKIFPGQALLIPE